MSDVEFEREKHVVTWTSWQQERRRAQDAEAERDRLRAALYEVQMVLDETLDTDERTQVHVLVQEILNSETRRAELIEAGRAAELESKTIAGEYRRRAETAVTERDRLQARVVWLRRAYGKAWLRRWSLQGIIRDVNAARLSAKAERDELRSGLDTILNGLVGLDSDDAYVAITMEHLNVARAMLKKAGT